MDNQNRYVDLIYKYIANVQASVNLTPEDKVRYVRMLIGMKSTYLADPVTQEDNTKFARFNTKGMSPSRKSKSKSRSKSKSKSKSRSRSKSNARRTKKHA